MFHTIRASRIPGRTRHGATGVFVDSLHDSDRKAYFKGIVFTTAGSLILICGAVMAILGFTEVFGASVAMLGILLSAVAILLYLFAIRQFLLARKIRRSAHRMQITHGTVAAMVIERDDGAELGTVTVVMDTVNLRNRHSNHDDQAPPNYTEATSDFFPDSTVTSGMGNDADECGPPPYGPPKYEDVVSSDVMSQGDKSENINSEVVEQPHIVMPVNSPGSTSMNDSGAQPIGDQPRDTEPSRVNVEPAGRLLPVVHVSGYQDLPTVTI